MALTISLQPETEARYRAEAAREGMPPEEWAARRLLEAELLWRIRTASPATETRGLHGLLRRRRSGTLTDAERERLLALLDAREQRSAERLEDLAQLSRLRGVAVRPLMEQLGIRPIPAP